MFRSSCLTAVLIAFFVSILLYPVWKRGFGTFQNDIEISAASRGDGQFVDISPDANGYTQTLRIPVQHPVADQTWSIQFTYLGAKDDRSKANEVWILSVGAPKPVDFHSVPRVPGWELRFHTLATELFGLVAHTGTAAMQPVLLNGGTLSVRLLRHDRGGFVRVSVNGVPQDINLYSPTPGVATLTWQPVLPPGQLSPAQPLHARIESDRPLHALRVIGEPDGGVYINSVRLGTEKLTQTSPGLYQAASYDWSSAARAAAASVMTFVVVSAASLLLILVWRQQELVSPSLLRITAPLSAVTISLFWTAVFFPGHMSPDSFLIWRQAVTGEYHNGHPIGLTLVMRAVHLFLLSRPIELQLAVVTFLQGALFWLMIFRALTIIPFSLRKKMLLCVLVAGFYPLWVNSITLWKDVWFTTSFLGLVLCAVPFFASARSGWRHWTNMVAWLTCTLLSRHTAALSFMALATLAIVFLWTNRGPQAALRTLAISVTMLVCSWVIQAALYKTLQVRNDGRLSNVMLAYEVVGVTRFSNQPVSSFQNLQTYRAIGGSKFEQAVADYPCGGPIDYLFYYPGAPFDMDSLLAGSYASRDLPRLAFANPGAYLRHRACAVAGLMDLPGRGLFYPYHPQLDVNVFGAHEQSLLPGVRGLVMDRFLEPTISDPKWLALRVPFWHWLMLASSLAAAVFSLAGIPKTSKCLFAWRMMPSYFFAAGCAILIPLLFVTPTADWRYVMPASVCWLIGILTAGVLVSGPRGQRTERRRPQSILPGV